MKTNILTFALFMAFVILGSGQAIGQYTWTKDSRNPLLSGGGDERWVELGSVLLLGGTLHMWYDGGAPPAFLSKVGHATALITGVDEGARGIPQQFVLSQNYPNPFNPVTTIGLTLPGAKTGSGSTSIDNSPSTIDNRLGSGWVRLSVYDMLGREVAVLVNEKKEPGTIPRHGMRAGWRAVSTSVGSRPETSTNHARWSWSDRPNGPSLEYEHYFCDI